jgi:hypothetical protein
MEMWRRGDFAVGQLLRKFGLPRFFHSKQVKFDYVRMDETVKTIIATIHKYFPDHHLAEESASPVTGGSHLGHRPAGRNQ